MPLVAYKVMLNKSVLQNIKEANEQFVIFVEKCMEDYENDIKRIESLTNIICVNYSINRIF